MKEPNKEKLLERINGMKSICADGRREIKELISELIGEPLERCVESFSVGDVFEYSDGKRCMIVKIRSGYEGLYDSENFLENPCSESMTYEQRLIQIRARNGKLIGKARVVIDPV